jgi:PIN domain nuclease of toxin-antitoxin system
MHIRGPRIPHDILRINGEEALYQHLLNEVQIPLDHTDVQVSLPSHHRDPFDRIMVAQAIVENLPIVSADATLDRYGVTRIWS